MTNQTIGKALPGARICSEKKYSCANCECTEKPLQPFRQRIVERGSNGSFWGRQLEFVHLNGSSESVTDAKEIRARLRDVQEGELCVHTGFALPSEIVDVEKELFWVRFHTGVLTGTTNRADEKRTSPYQVRLGIFTAKVVEGRGGKKASDNVILSTVKIEDKPGDEEVYVRRSRLFEAYREVLRLNYESLFKMEYCGEWKKHEAKLVALVDEKFAVLAPLIKRALLRAEYGGAVYLVDFQREFNSLLKRVYGAGEIHEHSASPETLGHYFGIEERLGRIVEEEKRPFEPFAAVGSDGRGKPLRLDGNVYRSEDGFVVPADELGFRLSERTVYPTGITHVFMDHEEVLARDDTSRLLVAVVADQKHAELVKQNIRRVDGVRGGNSQLLLIGNRTQDLFTRFFWEGVG